jgi:hypothetical protein
MCRLIFEVFTHFFYIQGTKCAEFFGGDHPGSSFAIGLPDLPQYSLARANILSSDVNQILDGYYHSIWNFSQLHISEVMVRRLRVIG